MRTRPIISLFVVLVAVMPRTLMAQESAPAEEQVPPPPDNTELVPPKILTRVDPEYPPQALAEKRTGQVVLQLDIDTSGRVVEVSVAEGAGFGMDEAAVAAGRQLVFEPARRGDTAVRARILYRMDFALRVADPEPVAPETAAPAVPPPAELVGQVHLEQSAAPSVGTQVRITLSDGSTQVVTTDDTGSFTVRGAPAGVTLVQIEQPGFAPLTSRETLTSGERVEIKYRIYPVSDTLEVMVQGERVEREITRRTIERKELTLVPGTGGDALRVVSAMPGVARTGAFDGLIAVRGSSPYGTETFVDGAFVPQIYHFGGLSSVVPTEMIEAIDFYPGNFGAKYGRVSGGIIDVRLREIDQAPEYHGMAQVDLIDARLMLRGPIPLASGWFFNAGVRRSHVDAWIGSVVGDSAGFKTAPVYYDWQVFAETRPTAGSRFRVGFLGADDRLEMVFKDAMAEDPGMGNSFKMGSRTSRIQTVYENQINPAARVELTLSAGFDKENEDFGALSAVNVDYIPMIARGEFSYQLSDNFEVRVGPDIVAYHYDADVQSIAPPELGEMEGAHANRPILRFVEKGFFSAPAAYAELVWKPTTRAQVVLGGRADYFSLTERWDINPRLNARYDLRQGVHRTTLKGGLGLFSEPPQIIQAIHPFGNPDLDSNRALHASLGIEQALSSQADVSVEGFYKYLDRQVVSALNDDGSQGYSNNGRGYAYGTETMVRYKPGGRFFGWVAYTLSRSMRRENPGEPMHVFAYDQTHNLTVLGSYDLGRGFQVGSKFRLVSGSPYTPCEGGIQNAAAGTYECIEGAPHSKRIPTFYQLDVRLDKTWKLSENGRITAYLDVQNVTNRENPEGVSYNYRYTKTEWQTGLPIIPSLGLRGEF